MEKSLDTELVRCPACGRPVDKLRAGAVAVYETKMVYYCSVDCKSQHLGSPVPSAAAPASPDGPSEARSSSEPPAPPSIEAAPPEPATPSPRPSGVPAPVERASAIPLRPSAPEGAPPRVDESRHDEERPSTDAVSAPAGQESPEPQLEPQRVSPPQPPSVEEAPPELERPPEMEEHRPEAIAVDELPERAPRAALITDVGLFVRFIAGSVLFAVSSMAPSVASLSGDASARVELARTLQLALAAVSVAWLAIVTLRALQKKGWQTALEEGLATIGSLLMLITGYLFPRSTGALLAAPGIAALTWAGRWLEVVMRDALVSRLRPLHGLDGADRAKLEAGLWGEGPLGRGDGRSWTEPPSPEPLGSPLELKPPDILLQIAASHGKGASPVGKLARSWVFKVGVIGALPLSVIALVALLYFTSDPKIALIMCASLVLALSPRALRLGWIGPLLMAAAMGARKGLTFRDGAALEATARADCVVFDARGTLTMGEPVVTGVIRVGALPTDEILALAAGVEEAAGNDPLGRAIVNAARSKDLSPVVVRLARQSPGLGMSATSPQGDLLVGTRQLILGQGISVAEADEVAAELEDRAETVLFVALAGRIQGVIGLRDELRPGAKAVASAVNALGVEPVLMTADSHLTAESLGKELGFEHIRSEVAPEQWAEQIQSMRETGHGVAMVTRPPRHEDTLFAADVGITLGSERGLEHEPTGVAIGGDDPTLAVKAVALARGALKTVRFNLLVAAALLVIQPGLASQFVRLLPTPWLVPMAVAIVSAVVPAILCWDMVASPRRGRTR